VAREVNVGKKAVSAKQLEVHERAYHLAMEIFEVSKGFPKEERYALTDQIRRSSRAVCASLREAWSKRRYEAHFVSKLTDADAENSETDTWIDFAADCGYLTRAESAELRTACERVGRMLGAMLKMSHSFILEETPGA
jgi:four helix bundle protein